VATSYNKFKIEAKEELRLLFLSLDLKLIVARCH